MLLIVGLGNPTYEYSNAYHNIGFSVVDKIAEKKKIKFTDKEQNALIGRKNDLILAKPQTYMNSSGISIKGLVDQYQIDVSKELIVCYDDVDIDVGTYRFKHFGSAGTHNGMKSVIEELGRTDFKRLRIGIRNEKIANKEINLLDFVLSKISDEDQEKIDSAIEAGIQKIFELI